MSRNPILSLPLDRIMRPEIALPLQQVLQLHTVGALLNAWRSPKNHKSIERVFDSPQQAQRRWRRSRAWLGVGVSAQPTTISHWWLEETPTSAMA